MSTHKITGFGYLAPHKCVCSRTPTAYRELLRNYKTQEDQAMARPKKDVIYYALTLLPMPGAHTATACLQLAICQATGRLLYYFSLQDFTNN